MKWNETKSHLSSAQLARNLNSKIRNSTTVICLIHKRWYLAFIYSRLNSINFINYNPRMVYSAGRFLILVSCSCFFFFLCNYNVINYIMYIQYTYVRCWAQHSHSEGRFHAVFFLSIDFFIAWNGMLWHDVDFSGIKKHMGQVHHCGYLDYYINYKRSYLIGFCVLFGKVCWKMRANFSAKPF